MQWASLFVQSANNKQAQEVRCARNVSFGSLVEDNGKIAGRKITEDGVSECRDEECPRSVGGVSDDLSGTRGRPFGDDLTPIVLPCRIGWNLRNRGQPKKPRLPIATPHTLSFLNLSHMKISWTGAW